MRIVPLIMDTMKNKDLITYLGNFGDDCDVFIEKDFGEFSFTFSEIMFKEPETKEN